MMSTPAATSVESVRAKRAIVIFRVVSPICSGRRSRTRSQTRRPASVRLPRTKPYASSPSRGKITNQSSRKRVDAKSTHCVRVGSCPCSCAKIFTNTGTTNMSIATSVIPEKTSVIVG